MERSPTEDSVRTIETRLTQALVAAGDLAYDWDLATDRIWWAGNPRTLFGCGEAGLPDSGDSLSRLVNPEDLPARMQSLSRHFTGISDFDCEYRIKTTDGELQWVHDRGAVSLSPAGSPERMTGLLRIVTRRKHHEARLEYLASFDELTGHFNKLRLRDALEQALAQSLRFGQKGAFLVVGLDQLGRINAAFGHEAGDAVLRDVADRFDAILRNTDVVGRLDSDRFGIVLPGYDGEQAFRAAERILQSIRNEPVQIERREAHVTASASIVVFPDQSQTVFDVITKAEGALMQAKERGRDCIRVYELDSEQHQAQIDNLAVAEEVKSALRNDRLDLAYQPVVDAASGAVRFYECLLRLRQAGGALISAERFIPVVERLGLVRTIDRRVLELVVDDLASHPQVSLAINISGMTANDRSWLRALKGHLRGRPDLARRMIIEVTETVALHDIEESARFLSAVRDLGCRVAIDDFGAGYTTFRHLKALPVDIVKIDGSFVQGIATNPQNQLFIRNLLGLAESFSLETVAEKIETREDAAFLRDEGVGLLQGYYFGKPQIVPAWKGGQDKPVRAQAGGAGERG